MTRGIYVEGRAYPYQSEKIPICICWGKENRERERERECNLLTLQKFHKKISQLALLDPSRSIFAPKNIKKLTNSNGLLHPRQLCLIQLRCIPGHDFCFSLTLVWPRFGFRSRRNRRMGWAETFLCRKLGDGREEKKKMVKGKQEGGELMVVGYVIGSPFLSLVIISKIKLNDGPHGLSARSAQGLVADLPAGIDSPVCTSQS